MRCGGCAIAPPDEDDQSPDSRFFFFGGEDDEAKMLGDAWLLTLVNRADDDDESVTTPKTTTTLAAVWQRIALSVIPRVISPRASSAVFQVSVAGQMCVTVAIVGGLHYPLVGEQQSFRDSFFVQLNLDDEAARDRRAATSSDGNLRGAIIPMTASFGSGDNDGQDATVPFPPFPVNTMLQCALNDPRRRHLLFGGKDTSRGNDDLYFVRCCVHNETRLPFLKVDRVVKCPFKEGIRKDDDVEKTNANGRTDDIMVLADGDSSDSDVEVEACLSVLVNRGGNAYPHWRYAAAAVAVPISSSSEGAERRTLVFCVGGTARHPDRGNECVSVVL
jgi:hypothetical protein